MNPIRDITLEGYRGFEMNNNCLTSVCIHGQGQLTENAQYYTCLLTR